MAEPKPIGRVSSYFSHIGVAAIELTDKLKVGDKIRIKGATTDLTQTVDSMQIEHKLVKEAKKKDSVGIKVNDKVRPNDLVYKE
ncbi:MAG: Translation elongation factor-like protein [archaeon GW2011_AR20]|nr:MAG: Translation elongation factor-like protein [archaeon GW2011_AR20]MBS3160615.1 translation elongation factor-like protein [Candidatus Woesearchaeota archaeon]